jgi:hypothetical protein
VTSAFLPDSLVRRASLLAILFLLSAIPAFAQVDFAGEWQAHNGNSEDQAHRVPGPTLGDYTGLPINDAARQKATTWDASVLSQPERQAQPHPAQYSVRGGGGPRLHIEKVLDPTTRQLVAYTMCCFFGGYTRTIWMDGRAHPSEYAEHTWDGFSTGEWVGSSLKVTTTHMKMGVIQRNGVPASPYATLVEFWSRHDDHLGVFSWVDDPMYLEEPFVRTTDWTWNPGQDLANQVPFDTVDELGDKPLGWVPSWPIGTTHHDLADQFHIPFEATQGGARTLYPEYMKEIQRLQQQAPAPQQP